MLKYAVVIGGIVLLAGIVIILLLLRQSATIDERIAQFEARRKIPDSENAAVIYNKIFEKYNYKEFDPCSAGIKIDDSNYLSKFWKRQDFPDAAVFLDKYQGLISELYEVRKYNKCNFPIIWDSFTGLSSLSSDNLFLSKKLAQLLVLSSNNGVGEGKIDEAIEKLACLLTISNHMSQQPTLINQSMGMAFETLCLARLKYLIVESNISEKQLQTVQEFPFDVQNKWEDIIKEQSEAEELNREKIFQKLPPLEHLKYRLIYKKSLLKSISIIPHHIYLNLLTDRRTNRIFIGLRRYKNQNGVWPASLEEIKPFIKEKEAFVDPQNGGTFVYKKIKYNFTLYSRGANNIDEGGKYNTDSQGKILTDDWMIWPAK